MRRLLLFIPLLITVGIGIFLFAGIGKDPTKLESARIGKPVPEFQLQEIDVDRNTELSIIDAICGRAL